MLNARIAGIASYVPSDILDNDMLSKMVDTNDEWITSRVGIKEHLKRRGCGLVLSWCASGEQIARVNRN